MQCRRHTDWITKAHEIAAWIVLVALFVVVFISGLPNTVILPLVLVSMISYIVAPIVINAYRDRKSLRLTPGEMAVVVGNTKCEKCEKLLFVAAVISRDLASRLKTVTFSDGDLFNKETQLKEEDAVVMINDGNIVKICYR